MNFSPTREDPRPPSCEGMLRLIYRVGNRHSPGKKAWRWQIKITGSSNSGTRGLRARRHLLHYRSTQSKPTENPRMLNGTSMAQQPPTTPLLGFLCGGDACLQTAEGHNNFLCLRCVSHMASGTFFTHIMSPITFMTHRK